MAEDNEGIGTGLGVIEFEEVEVGEVGEFGEVEELED